MRLSQNVATVDHITTFLNQLDDMESIFRFDNFRHGLGVRQVEGYIGKLRNECSTTGKPQFATLYGRRLVFRIKARKCRELSTAVVDAFGVTAQFFLHAINLFLRNLRFASDDLTLYASGHKRNAVFGQLFEEAAHLSRRHLDILHQIALHFVHHLVITNLIIKQFTNLCRRFTKVLLHLLLRADVLNIVVDALVYSLEHVSISHLYRVDGCLVKKEFLNSQLFWYHTIRIAIPTLTLLKGIQTCLLHVRLENSLIPDNPHHFIYHVVTTLGKGAKRQTYKCT